MPRGRSRTEPRENWFLRSCDAEPKYAGRVVEIRRQGQQVLIAEPSRNVAAEAGVGVGKLQASAYHSAHRIGDVSAQRNLQAAVERASGGKKHGVASHQRIDSGKGRARIRSQTKQGCRALRQELTAGIQAVAGEIGNAGTGHRGQVAADRSLRTGPGASGGRARCAERVRGQRVVDRIQRRIRVQVRSRPPRGWCRTRSDSGCQHCAHSPR